MPNVREIAEEIVAREGGFVNDPDDPGRGHESWGDDRHAAAVGDRREPRHADRRGRCEGAEPGAGGGDLSEALFRGPGIGALPEAVQASVFDMYVNAGGNAVKILQRLLTDMGFPCEPDGVDRAADHPRGADGL
jgi:lysozyme family protein